MTELPADQPVETKVADVQPDWFAEPVAPWRRYGARALDIIVSGGVGLALLGLGLGLIAPESAERIFSVFDGGLGSLIDMYVTLIAAGFFNAIIMGATGTTLGKAIFGIKVVMPDQSNLGFASCFSREFWVWVYGFGLGIPIVSLFTIYKSYHTLTSKKQTSWDEGRFLVLYRPPGSRQTILNVFGVVLILAGRMLFRYLAMS